MQNIVMSTADCPLPYLKNHTSNFTDRHDLGLHVVCDMARFKPDDMFATS